MTPAQPLSTASEHKLTTLNGRINFSSRYGACLSVFAEPAVAKIFSQTCL